MVELTLALVPTMVSKLSLTEGHGLKPFSCNWEGALLEPPQQKNCRTQLFSTNLGDCILLNQLEIFWNFLFSLDQAGYQPFPCCPFWDLFLCARGLSFCFCGEDFTLCFFFLF